MANSLTVEQKAKELQVGNRRAIKTSLIPSLYISIEEGTSTVTLTLHRERREMSGKTIPSFSLYFFILSLPRE